MPSIQHTVSDTERRLVVWSPVRQASCEAIHRAVTERAQDPSASGLAQSTTQLRQRIVGIVRTSSERDLHRLVAREIGAHGFMPGGWSARWPDPEGQSQSPHRPSSVPPPDVKEAVVKGDATEDGQPSTRPEAPRSTTPQQSSAR